jgi:hypothetical protein
VDFASLVQLPEIAELWIHLHDEDDARAASVASFGRFALLRSMTLYAPLDGTLASICALAGWRTCRNWST